MFDLKVLKVAVFKHNLYFINLFTASGPYDPVLRIISKPSRNWFRDALGIIEKDISRSIHVDFAVGLCVLCNWHISGKKEAWQIISRRLLCKYFNCLVDSGICEKRTFIVVFICRDPPIKNNSNRTTV